MFCKSSTREIPKGEEDIDRGWAWVILFAAFMNFFLCSVLYTSGIFNVMFLEQYQKSKTLTSWTGALAVGLLSLLAPLGSICVHYLGPRITIMIGGLLTSLGYSLTYFATSIIHVIITFGFMQGTGICIMYYSSLVSLGFYFRRYRNLAYGFALTGVGVGVMVYPILLDYFVVTYGERGALLIIAGIQTHSFVVGALSRPFKKKTKQSQYNHCRALTSSKCDISIYNIEKHNSILEESKLDLDESVKILKIKCKEVQHNIDKINGEKETRIEKICQDVSEFNTVKRVNTNKSKSITFIEQVKGMCVAPFVALCINLFLNGIGFYSICVHFPAYGKSIGISPQFTSILLSIMGGASLFSRIIVGIATNGSKSRTVVTYVGSGFASGIVCFIGPYLCVEKFGQIAFSIAFSCFGNIFIALMSPVIIDLMGLERSVSSTGIALFVCGIGSLGGPPLLGLLADLTGTYYYIFPFNGLCFMVGGLVMLIVPVQKRIQKFYICRDKLTD